MLSCDWLRAMNETEWANDKLISTGPPRPGDSVGVHAYRSKRTKASSLSSPKNHIHIIGEKYFSKTKQW